MATPSVEHKTDYVPIPRLERHVEYIPVDRYTEHVDYMPVQKSQVIRVPSPPPASRTYSPVSRYSRFYGSNYGGYGPYFYDRYGYPGRSRYYSPYKY